MKIGFSSALFLVFLVLKLIDTIDWSWWWITAPLWGDFILSVWAEVIFERKKRARQEAYYSFIKNREIRNVFGKKSKFVSEIERRMKEQQDSKNKN